MFKYPFSFKGRITRMEYTLSITLSLIILILVIGLSTNYKHEYLANLFMFLAYLLFNITQGNKRCHDINQSGFVQFIPFYVFVLIFENGTHGSNKYGEAPKTKR